MKNLISLAALIGTMFSASPLWAHGSEEHEQKGKHVISTDQALFGREGDPKKATRTIKITMDDTMRYTPDTISVKQGETIRLVIENKGKTLHELVMGSEKELKEHAELMKKFPDMEHSAPYMAHVGTGKQREIIWEFNRPGDVLFGCLMPGHYEAGMAGKITVTPKA